MKENYFRIKMSFPIENEAGKLEKAKAEDLVYAVNYTDAEKVAQELVRSQHRDELGEPEYEIVKTKIADVRPSKLLYIDHNETLAGLVYSYFSTGANCCDGLYQVKLRYENETESDKGADFKNTTEWVIAGSSDHARRLAEARYQGLSPKTLKIEFDHTESIIVPERFFEMTSED